MDYINEDDYYDYDYRDENGEVEYADYYEDVSQHFMF